jgi:hypothetical protein
MTGSHKNLVSQLPRGFSSRPMHRSSTTSRAKAITISAPFRLATGSRSRKTLSAIFPFADKSYAKAAIKKFAESKGAKLSTIPIIANIASTAAKSVKR